MALTRSIDIINARLTGQQLAAHFLSDVVAPENREEVFTLPPLGSEDMEPTALLTALAPRFKFWIENMTEADSYLAQTIVATWRYTRPPAPARRRDIGQAIVRQAFTHLLYAYRAAERQLGMSLTEFVEEALPLAYALAPANDWGLTRSGPPVFSGPCHAPEKAKQAASEEDRSAVGTFMRLSKLVIPCFIQVIDDKRVTGSGAPIRLFDRLYGDQVGRVPPMVVDFWNAWELNRNAKTAQHDAIAAVACDTLANAIGNGAEIENGFLTLPIMPMGEAPPAEFEPLRASLVARLRDVLASVEQAAAPTTWEADVSREHDESLRARANLLLPFVAGAYQ